MFTRIALFILTNILVMTLVVVITQMLGIEGYMTEAGLNYQALLIFCLLWGMVGSFISLALSRVMAKWMMKVQVIPTDNAGEYRWLVDMIHDLSRRAKLPKMPEVGVYQSPDVNAFATGPSKSRSLVAVSTGLLNYMSRDEIEGVMAHEVAHIKNGDMVTMTLIQGIVNAFVMFFARIIAFAISNQVKEEQRWLVNFVSIIVLQILFGILGSMVTAWFSRQREFRADSGSGKLAGKDKMIAALEALKRMPGRGEIPAREGEEAVACLQISNNTKKKSLMQFFSTHPALDDRIKALQGA